MTVKELIEFLQAMPQDVQDMQVAYRTCSEQAIVSTKEMSIQKCCEPRPDGWVPNARPDKPTQEYLIIGF